MNICHLGDRACENVCHPGKGTDFGGDHPPAVQKGHWQSLGCPTAGEVAGSRGAGGGKAGYKSVETRAVLALLVLGQLVFLVVEKR